MAKYDQVTKGQVYGMPACARAQCVDVMFSNIYSAEDWTLEHWLVFMPLPAAPPQPRASIRLRVYNMHAQLELITNDAQYERIAVAYSVPITAYTCRLCGQRITDGKPCGCGARY